MNEYENGRSTELEMFPQAGIVFDAPKIPDHLPAKPNRLPEWMELARIRQELKIIAGRRRKSG